MSSLFRGAQNYNMTFKIANLLAERSAFLQARSDIFCALRASTPRRSRATAHRAQGALAFHTHIDTGACLFV
jgi:hypothetical protein